jgi:MFS family permease
MTPATDTPIPLDADALCSDCSGAATALEVDDTGFKSRKPWGIFVTAFFIDLAVMCVGLSLQFLGVRLLASPRVLGMLGAFQSAGYAPTCLISGRIADRIGRKRCAVIGLTAAVVVWCLYTRAPSVYWLLALTPISGVALGMVWPGVQAWLAERTEKNHRALNRNLGLFNMAWSSGLVVGPLFAGHIWNDQLPNLPFVICAGIGVIAIGVLLSTSGGGPGVCKADASSAEEGTESNGHPLWRLFMRLAWIGNFASWFTGAVIGTMFPKLALTTMGLTHSTVGVLVFCYWAALMLAFFLARTTQIWQFKMWPLVAAEGMSMLALLTAGLLANSAIVFGICFATCGICSGVTYVSSLFYSINGPPESCARRTGYHEAVLGAGSLTGGLISGEIATALGLRVPYIFAAGLLVTAAIIQTIALTRHSIHSHQADPPTV